MYTFIEKGVAVVYDTKEDLVDILRRLADSLEKIV